MNKKVSIIKKIGEKSFMDTVLAPCRPWDIYQPKQPARAAEMAETMKKKK